MKLSWHTSLGMTRHALLYHKKINIFTSFNIFLTPSPPDPVWGGPNRVQSPIRDGGWENFATDLRPPVPPGLGLRTMLRGSRSVTSPHVWNKEVIEINKDARARRIRNRLTYMNQNLKPFFPRLVADSAPLTLSSSLE